MSPDVAIALIAASLLLIGFVAGWVMAGSATRRVVKDRERWVAHGRELRNRIIDLESRP